MNQVDPVQPDTPAEGADDAAFAAVEGLMAADRQVNIAVAARLRWVQKLIAAELALHNVQSFGHDELAYRSVRAEVATALRFSERSADKLIMYATSLYDTLPVMAQAFDAGDVSYAHVQIPVDGCLGLSDEQTAQLEAKAVPKAVTQTPGRFTQFVRRAREALDPKAIEERTATAFLKRSVLEQPDRDGMSSLILFGNLFTFRRSWTACRGPRSG